MSSSNIPLDYTTIMRRRRSSRRGEMFQRKRLFADEVYTLEENCVICLERDCQSSMKMCPSCENIFHTHCIAGWLVEFMNHSCPHCRIRLTHRMLEDVEVVLPLKVLCTSSTQTVGQTNPVMGTEHDYSSSLPGPSYLPPGSRVARLTLDSGERSPVSPTWSPISPYPHHTPSIIVSPAITVSVTPESAVSTPSANSNFTFSPGEIPESPLPPTLGNTATYSAPFTFTANLHTPAAGNESPRDVWGFIAEQLRREGWYSSNSASPFSYRAPETQ